MICGSESRNSRERIQSNRCNSTLDAANSIQRVQVADHQRPADGIGRAECRPVATIPSPKAELIGHELAHHALGHTGIIRGTMRQVYRPISRLDEFSCDAVANELVGDQNVSLNAITLLTVGPQLYPQVNQAALREQVEKVMKNKKTKKSESASTHPHILRRYGALLGMKI